ncbi:MAG: type II secretion system protein [Candidatus Omnitrophota bacterium]|nr:type II secretion system protein [Candidatus Omnitrophota bacterium]
MKKSPNGFTLVEVLIVVAILGFLIGIAMPNVMKARSAGQESACQSNMAIIEAAIEQWGLDSNIASGTDIAGNVGDWDDYLRGGILPACPNSGAYSYTGGGTAGTTGNYKVHCSVHGDVN